MEPGNRPARRLVGAASLLAALCNLGLFRRIRGAGAGLQGFVADDGQAIPVRVAGPEAAPEVVLLHGLACSHRHWQPVMRRLARRVRVLAWDARGHGACRLLGDGAVDLPRLARDLRGLIEHFGLRRPLLLGHSMGALTVLQYLQDHGSAGLYGVALVDQSPRVLTDEHWALGLFGGCNREMLLGLVSMARRNPADTLAREVQAAGLPWLARQLASDRWAGAWLRRRLARLETGPLLDLAESLALADFRALLPTLALPTWVVLGARSPHYAGVPLEGYYRRTVQHARVQVYLRSAHSPHLSEAARFADDLLRFIDEHA